MIIVDTEASGVNARKNSLVSIGAVELENPTNQFYAECRVWEGAHIEDEALAVNGFTREELLDPKKKTEGEILRDFLMWAESVGEKTLAGQNPMFDLDFLQETAFRNHINWPFAHRSIDLHSMVYLHMVEKGIEPPKDVRHHHSALNSDTIMKYVGIPEEPKPHIGINGARYEAEAFSRLLFNKPLFEEFKKFPIPWTSN
jgi:DNA polymerase III epsilon subunit-like protein